MQNMFSQLCFTLLAIERCRIDLSGEHKKQNKGIKRVTQADKDSS